MAPARTPEQQDESNLELLKVFFYVYSGLVALSALLVAGILVAMMLGIGFAGSKHGNETEAAVTMGIVFVIFGLAMLLLLAKTVAVFLAGRYVGERSHHTFIFVVAIICCLNVPFGTALGVCALILLSKDSVKRRFGV